MDIKALSINTIRLLAAEAVQKANSGHPGLPMGAAPAAFTLWSEHLRHNPGRPDWFDRDRFILSAGHGSMLLYSMLHLFGYGLEMDELKRFRQLDSKTPGHPEYGHTVGVEATTGPLGQGIANAVGMAMAEAYLAEKFNKEGFNIIDHYTYALAGDGCMMEGVASEAASLAGSLGLGKLIVLYDSNDITIEGSTSIAFRENVGRRFEAYGWQVQRVEDGNDTEAVSRAIAAAKAEKNKPSLIEVRSIIAYGSPKKQGKASAHGEPLGDANIAEAKEYLGWEPKEAFHVPEEVLEYMKALRLEAEKNTLAWDEKLEKYRAAYPGLAAEFNDWVAGKLPEPFTYKEIFSTYVPKATATRAASGDLLQILAGKIPNLLGGSADLAPSTKTLINGRGDFSMEDHSGANLHFGVREHAMAAAANGMLLHGGLRPYVSTFFVFTDYMKASMRLSALMKLPVIYVLTHDSIGVGEDGPTHQPVEHLAALRSIPGFTVFRPADARETAAGWLAALNWHSPTALILTRQNLPLLEGSGEEALKGAYVLLDSKKEVPEILLMASGSEVYLVLEAGKALQAMGVDARVVSMPSWELFEEQSPAYRQSILPNSARKRLAVEAGASFGWHRYVGLDGDTVTMESFGASAPADELFNAFGYTVGHILEKAKALLKAGQDLK